MRKLLSAILLLAGLPGCVIVEVGVVNPIPGLSTVAVAPFFNLSAERDLDGRRFAMAYFGELQKTPGFQVVPVGVTEAAIVEHGLQMNDPADAMKLAEILNVDAVVVGAITEYYPYYPPRVGWQVSWYSPRSWEFKPGTQIDPYARRRFEYAENQEEWPHEYEPGETQGLDRVRKVADFTGISKLRRREDECVECEPTIRPQSPDLPPGVEEKDVIEDGWESADVQDVSEPPAPGFDAAPGTAQLDPAPAAPPMDAVQENSGAEPPPLEIPEQTPASMGPPITGSPPLAPIPDSHVVTYVCPPEQGGLRDLAGRLIPGDGAGAPKRPIPTMPPDYSDPHEPLMSYTRLFDGTDSDLQASLRDYVELNVDQRSGGWEAYLQRSDDFIRFTAHRMIVEMLMLHGGEGKKRVIFTHRKFN